MIKWNDSVGSECTVYVQHCTALNRTLSSANTEYVLLSTEFDFSVVLVINLIALSHCIISLFHITELKAGVHLKPLFCLSKILALAKLSTQTTPL